MLRYPHPLIGFSGCASFRAFSLFLFALALSVLGACKNNQVGRACFIAGSAIDGGVATDTVVGSPAIECESSICLHVQGQSDNECTARCSADSDCETSPESPCKTGFTCAIPTVTGAFCCERLCICKDFLGDAGTLPDPAACVASNAANECCNLEGRSGSSKYPQCN